jgi:type IV secretory pathway TraG/TraD family ATPase VirD4
MRPYALDPPLSLLLNEAANICALPSLPTLVSSGGGRGMPAMVVLQSLGQARHRRGDAQADAIWDAANVKVIFVGLAQAGDLARISRLAGEVDQTTISRSRGAGGASWSTGLRRIPVLGIEDLRSLPAGHAVLSYRHLRPAHIRLAPWWRLPIAAAVRDSQEALPRSI